MGLEKQIREVIARVNSTLNIYEAEYIKCQRTSESEKEICMSFEQFIEIRFNKECEKIPELRAMILETEGHLFLCTDIEEPNLAKRRFKSTTLTLVSPDMVEDISESMKKKLQEIESVIGGSKVMFNSVKKKIKYKILWIGE